MAKTTLLVCTTCRRIKGEVMVEKNSDEPRPGRLLLEALGKADLPEGVHLRGVECMSACANGSTIALKSPGKWSYIYGRMDVTKDVGAIAEGVRKYHASQDGIVPFKERPEIFRKQSIARIPPLPDTE